MVESKSNGSSNWWWLDSHNKINPNRSHWLQSTLSELDAQTKTILKIIEEDADSFAQRAEMYYKKRPELITMVEDFYRNHRSLAEKYDQLKSDSGNRLQTSWSTPLSYAKYKLEKSLSLNDKSYDSYSEPYGPDESDQSDVEDPEEEEKEKRVQENLESVSEEITKLREELERLKEENAVQRRELMVKDEEKREVIRQLSVAMDSLREENVKLKKCLVTKKGRPTKEFDKLKENFLGKLFNGFGKSQANLVAL